MRSQNFI